MDEEEQNKPNQSLVWNWCFKLSSDVAQCNICGKMMPTKCESTLNLWTHLKEVHEIDESYEHNNVNVDEEIQDNNAELIANDNVKMEVNVFEVKKEFPENDGGPEVVSLQKIESNMSLKLECYSETESVSDCSLSEEEYKV